MLSNVRHWVECRHRADDHTAGRFWAGSRLTALGLYDELADGSIERIARKAETSEFACSGIKNERPIAGTLVLLKLTVV